MLKEDIFIINRLGLHARAASAFIQLANRFQSDIKVSYKEQTINGKSILGLMMLAAAKGACITLEINGSDEKKAMKALKDLINNYFNEGE